MGQCYLNGWQWWGLHEAWWGVEVESVLLVISLSSLCQNQKVLNWKPLDCISSFWFLIAHCSVLISFDRRTLWYCAKGSSSVEFNDGRFYRDQLHFINCRQKLQSAAGLTFPSLNHFISERISEGVENIENFLRPGKDLFVQSTRCNKRSIPSCCTIQLFRRKLQKSKLDFREIERAAVLSRRIKRESWKANQRGFLLHVKDYLFSGDWQLSAAVRWCVCTLIPSGEDCLLQ